SWRLSTRRSQIQCAILRTVMYGRVLALLTNRRRSRLEAGTASGPGRILFPHMRSGTQLRQPSWNIRCLCKPRSFWGKGFSPGTSRISRIESVCCSSVSSVHPCSSLVCCVIRDDDRSAAVVGHARLPCKDVAGNHGATHGFAKFNLGLLLLKLTTTHD